MYSGLTQLYANRDDDELGELFSRTEQWSQGGAQDRHRAYGAHLGRSRRWFSSMSPKPTFIRRCWLRFSRVYGPCLEAFDGYAIIATHLPVVLQETPGEICPGAAPGSRPEPRRRPSVGSSFPRKASASSRRRSSNLGHGSTDWHETLSALARRSTLEEIEEAFGRKLGFAALLLHSEHSRRDRGVADALIPAPSPSMRRALCSMRSPRPSTNRGVAECGRRARRSSPPNQDTRMPRQRSAGWMKCR